MISEKREGTASANALGRGVHEVFLSEQGDLGRPMHLEQRDGGIRGEMECRAPVYRSLEDLGLFSVRWETLWGLTRR